jgi:hypothetical protein
MPGTATSDTEVTNISKHGFWLLLDGRELFLPFEEFPWFKRAPHSRPDPIQSGAHPAHGAGGDSDPTRTADA